MGGNFIGATGLDENQEQFDILQENIDANASYINNLVGIPDPVHLSLFGINPLNPGLYGLVERAEVNIAALQSGEEGLGTDLSALTTQVEGIETQITGIQGEITSIQGEITGIEGEISLIQFTELPAIVSSIAVAAGVAGDALGKANKSLGIWDEDGNNTYNMKSGNVAIGILPKGTLLNNKLEVNGSINIPTNSKYKINNVPLSYSDLAGTPPVSSKWTNATDVATNIYYSTGNVGIGITTAINNKLEVGGNLNISAGSKYKINNVNLAFSDLGGTLSYNSLTDKLTAGTNISIVGNAINNTYTYTLPTAGVGAGGTLGGVKVDNSTITINNGVISAAAATPQVNSDWTQTNDNLKSFIQNKPTAGNNISFANNTITNTITGSTSQNIIGLNTNELIVVDKPNTEKIEEVFIPLTNEPYSTPSVVPTTEGNPITYKTLTYTFNQGNIAAYYKFNNSSSLGIDSNPSNTKYNLTPTIVGGTGGYNTTIAVEGASFQATNDGDRLEGDLPLKTLFDSSATGISISLWFYKKSATYDNIYNTQVYRFVDPSNPLLVIMFYLSHHSNTYKSGFSIQYGVSGEIYAGGIGPVLAFDTWYHLVFIITKSGTIKVYINGTNLNLVAGSVDGTIRYYGSSVYPLPTASFPNTTKLKIFVPYGEGSFSGNVDEFYVFNKELSQAEITSLYNKTFSIPINQYTLSVPLSGTGVIINNTTLQYLSAGNYTISVGATQSSVVIAGIGQVGSDPYPLQNGSTIAFKYSMTQRTQATTYYKKDGLIKYVPASGTNPSTGTWNIIDLDSQLLSQFAGNLPFTRIDGNVPASRIDNLALSLGMDLTGVNGATQIKLTSGIVVVEGNLYSTGVNYFKYNVWHLDSDGFQRFYFQQSNTTYIKGHGTTPFEFRNGANTNICNISGSGGLSMASYLQGSGAGGGFRLVRPDTWVRMKSADETTHLDFAAQNLYAHGTLDAQGIINLNNFTYVKMQSIANTGVEYVCVVGNDAQGAYYNKVLYIAYGTFTGFHRCYVEDELCNDDNIDIFKNEYIGRVVISTGKIKTDASRKKEGEENEHEWYSLEGKEGITIEDALPIIQLSRVRKDKRVYGVLGDPKRGTNNNSRIIVNGCGEGAICVANTNGNIENGDYIQTSDLLGYGEKQDDDLHRNYTIAKAVMDCTFELDNPNYECKELSSGVRVAMIACVYKAS